MGVVWAMPERRCAACVPVAASVNSPRRGREIQNAATGHRYYRAARQMIPNGMNSPSERNDGRNASSASALAAPRLIIPSYSS